MKSLARSACFVAEDDTRQVRIHSADIPTIIFHFLQLQFFTVADRGFVQTHGSPMGSPLSPALCNMVISAHEEVWRRTFAQSFSSMNRNLLCLRYVDNRLWISKDRVASLPGVRLFLSNHFYGGDIVLEDEPAYDFVGFSLDIPARTIRYNRNCHIKDLPLGQWVTVPRLHHTTMCIPCFTGPCRPVQSLKFRVF